MKRAIKIEPFRHPVALDPAYAGEAACNCSTCSCAMWFRALGRLHALHPMHTATLAACHSIFALLCWPADKTWRVLEDAIREIHNQNASGLSFEELYRLALLASL